MRRGIFVSLVVGFVSALFAGSVLANYCSENAYEPFWEPISIECTMYPGESQRLDLIIAESGVVNVVDRYVPYGAVRNYGVLNVRQGGSIYPYEMGGRSYGVIYNEGVVENSGSLYLPSINNGGFIWNKGALRAGDAYLSMNSGFILNDGLMGVYVAPDGYETRFVNDGVIDGAGKMLVFSPHLITNYFQNNGLLRQGGVEVVGGVFENFGVLDAATVVHDGGHFYARNGGSVSAQISVGDQGVLRMDPRSSVSGDVSVVGGELILAGVGGERHVDLKKITFLDSILKLQFDASSDFYVGKYVPLLGFGDGSDFQMDSTLLDMELGEEDLKYRLMLSGNELGLVVTDVPEPSCMLMAAVSIGLLVRRRHMLN